MPTPLFHLRAVAAAAVLGTATLLLPDTAQAQAQGSSTLHACYVPRSGTVYRIKTPDTPPACVRPSHVPFSWQSGPAASGLYAVVGASGAMDPGMSRGFLGATRYGPGHYCVSAPAGLVASRPAFVGAADPDDPVIVVWNTEAGPDKAGYCGADEYGVSIYLHGLPTDYPFTIFVP